MKEQGIVIFQDGSSLKFGKMVYMNQDDYFDSPGHEESFIDEVLTSFEFISTGLEYDYEKNLYVNCCSFSQHGLIVVFNNRLSLDDPENILVYVTSKPSIEQLATIETLEIANIDNQDVFEFLSDDLDDNIQYDNLHDYVSVKEREINSNIRR